jgi:hypothetical protein
VGGCVKKSTERVAPKDLAPPPKRFIVNEGGKLTRYSEGEHRRQLWHIEWQKAEAQVSGEIPTFGTMTGVRGEIYQNGKPPKVFRADTAIADKQSDVLTLSGQVSVYSPDQKANLKCDKVVWDPHKEIVQATGNVTVGNDKYTLTGLPAIMARSDFSVIATPDMFQEANAARH